MLFTSLFVVRVCRCGVITGMAFRAVVDEFLVATAYRGRPSSGARRRDFTGRGKWEKGDWGDSAGFLSGILQNFVGITVDCCNRGQNIVKGQDSLVGSCVLFEAA